MSSDNKQDAGNTAAEEDTLIKTPSMSLAQHTFILASDEIVDKGTAREDLLAGIKEDDMAPYYEHVCSELGWMVDDQLLSSLQEKNAKTLAELEQAIADAEENLGESEIREAVLAKAQHFCRIGDKDRAVPAFQEAFDKSVGIGSRMDVVFSLIRLGFFFGDDDLASRNLDRAESLLEEGGDWDRRNRLKVYRGLYCVTVRDFKKAATLFLEAVSTFTSYELLSYSDFVGLAVLVSMLSLSRPDLKAKVIHGPEVQEALHNLPTHKRFLDSLFQCNYADFFKSLAEVETVLKSNRYMSLHRAFYVREMRILAYQQLLESYASLTLSSMAASFGVSVAFIDRELSRFIAAGRLNCKVDKVSGIVETTRPDKKNAQYQQTIKKGDMLLNRLQKLSQVINI